MFSMCIQVADLLGGGMIQSHLLIPLLEWYRDDVFGEQDAYEMQDEATLKQMLHEVLDLGRRKQLYVCIHQLFIYFFIILGLASSKFFFFPVQKRVHNNKNKHFDFVASET